ncbi:hypothetical protein QBC34DRAFT_459338 [Podospora aff. communis PSN243]|uniref:Uncharacterized protein n=1 Tax=Podospora aff. communis PSN243 TaxID=3040156 RepID=A0AAV9GU62_9PEZI|nr:hypothetical protein QBC34DRAFT_459338 [Podospora aff. communis PSN243]
MLGLTGIALFLCATVAHAHEDHKPPCHNPPPPTTLTTTTTTLPASCTTTPTQTFYSSSGCSLSCSTGFCITDAAVTISCGCSRVAISPTTITVCPTKTPCYQCYTGWGTFFVTETCPPTSAVVAAATPTA